MPSLIIKQSEDERSVVYDASEADEPLDKMFRYIHFMPAEIDRIKHGSIDEVQSILRRYI